MSLKQQQYFPGPLGEALWRRDNLYKSTDKLPVGDTSAFVYQSLANGMDNIDDEIRRLIDEGYVDPRVSS